MIAWVFLTAAIVSEVAATLCLRMAVTGGRIWYAAVGLGYVIAFSCLSLTLANGMDLAVAYGIWAAGGVALTAMLSHLLFREPLTWVMGLGIVLVATGVLMVELG